MVGGERSEADHVGLWAVSLFRWLRCRLPRRSGGCNRASEGQDGSIPARLPKTCERQAPRIRARAVEFIMTGNTKDPKLRHPDTAAYLQSLTHGTRKAAAL